MSTNSIEDLKEPAYNESYPLHIITVGNSKVGKTSLIFSFFGKMFGDTHLSTIGIDKQIKIITIEDKKYKFYFWDTTGQERFAVLASQYLRKAHGVFFTYAINDRDSFNDIGKWVDKLKDNVTQKKISMTLIGNKNDLDDERKVSYEEGVQLANDLGMSFFETSAKTRCNVNECFMDLVNKVVENNKDFVEQKNFKLEGGKKKKKGCC